MGRNESAAAVRSFELRRVRGPLARSLVNERLFRLTESSWKSREGGEGREEEREGERERPSSVSPTKHAFSLDCIDSNREGGREGQRRDRRQDRKGLGQTAGVEVCSLDCGQILNRLARTIVKQLSMAMAIQTCPLTVTPVRVTQ